MGPLDLVLLALAGGDLLINEVLYDPPGSDAGYEFVELFNPTALPLSLEGISLHFVNGGAPEAPQELWRGAPGSSLQPGSYLLLGESAVEGAQIRLSLALQNGPDALWLRRDGQTIDALAWGDVAGLGEGDPAPDVGSQSLARVPNGIDLDDNAHDFLPADPPTPGFANSQAEEFQLLELSWSPPWLESAGLQRARLTLLAVGDQPRQFAQLRFDLDQEPIFEQSLAADRGDTLRVERELRLSPGAHELRLSLQSTHAREWLIALQVGLAELAFHEILPRPAEGHSEWIELYCPQPELCAGRRYGLADQTQLARWFTLPQPLSEAYVLLAADCAQFGGAAGLLCIEPEAAWPSLNDRGSADAPADRLHLYDAGGTLIDWLPYGQGIEIARAQSLEAVRHGAHRQWFASPVAPTPGAPNATQSELPDATGLQLSPNPYPGVGTLLHVLLRSDSDGASAEAEIRDLRGRTVRALGSSRSASQLQQWIWDGRDEAGRALEPGAYLVLVRARAADGVLHDHRELLAIGGTR